MPRKNYIMVDGPDGAGKGLILDSVESFLKKTHSVIRLCEPTMDGIGEVIRNELIKTGTGRDYSASTTAMACAIDREILYRKTVLPALEGKVYVIQDRGLPASLAYQTAQAGFLKERLSLKDILSMPGNRLALANAPGLLLIPDVDVETAMQRLSEREKKDDSIFENPEFQKKVRDFYHSGKFRKIFSKAGTKIIYINTGISKESTMEQSVAAVRSYIFSV